MLGDLPPDDDRVLVPPGRRVEGREAPQVPVVVALALAPELAPGRLVLDVAGPRGALDPGGEVGGMVGQRPRQALRRPGAIAVGSVSVDEHEEQRARPGLVREPAGDAGGDVCVGGVLFQQGVECAEDEAEIARLELRRRRVLACVRLQVGDLLPPVGGEVDEEVAGVRRALDAAEQDGPQPVLAAGLQEEQVDDLLFEFVAVRAAREPRLEQEDQFGEHVAPPIDVFEVLLVVTLGIALVQQLQLVDHAVVVSGIPGVRDDLLAPVGGVVGRLG